jgi:hypothetical protein
MDLTVRKPSAAGYGTMSIPSKMRSAPMTSGTIEERMMTLETRLHRP